MTAALEGGDWSAARPSRSLPPGKTRYLLYRRLGGSQGRSGRAEYLVSTGIRSRTVQPVAQSHIYIYIYPEKKDSRTISKWIACINWYISVMQNLNALNESHLKGVFFH